MNLADLRDELKVMAADYESSSKAARTTMAKATWAHKAISISQAATVLTALIDPPEALVEAVTLELADHFGVHRWAQMAEDKSDLRIKVRENSGGIPYDCNEPTRSDCREAARASIAAAAAWLGEVE